MRFHDKVDRILALEPDLVVVSECACPEVLLRRTVGLVPNDVAWEGTNPAKGLAVLAFGDWRLRVDERHVLKAGTTLPLRVTGPGFFRLLAVWNVPRWARRRRDPPPEPLGRATERLAPFLAAEGPVVVAGDFGLALLARRRNGSPGRSPLGRRLAELGLVSTYHHARGVAHGREPEPTFCRYRRLPGRHHTDYVFVDRATAGHLQRVEVGRAERWVPLSDHLPVVVDLVGPPRARLPDVLDGCPDTRHDRSLDCHFASEQPSVHPPEFPARMPGRSR
jgi:hypothetical protein